MYVLGIETSCDESGIAIYHTTRGLINHQLYSQVELHAEYGGVVPELASRNHIQKVIPLVDKALAETALTPEDLAGIAYTAGPGLMGALLVGASIACSLGLSWKKPVIPIHHMEGHLLAPMLEEGNAPEFPFLALLISGGHTMLVAVNSLGHYSVLGESLDDAAGEAFDKTAKLLGLGYPGGAVLAKLAEKGNKGQYQFPKPMTDRPGLDFSFSGLKTHVLNTFENSDKSDQTRADIAHAFEQAVADTLAIKCRRALKATGLKSLVIAGGVSANKTIREKLKTVVTENNATLFFPRTEFCTDNGAMIALAGALRLAAGKTDNSMTIFARARWPLDELN